VTINEIGANPSNLGRIEQRHPLVNPTVTPASPGPRQDLSAPPAAGDSVALGAESQEAALETSGSLPNFAAWNEPSTQGLDTRGGEVSNFGQLAPIAQNLPSGNSDRVMQSFGKLPAPGKNGSAAAGLNAMNSLWNPNGAGAKGAQNGLGGQGQPLGQGGLSTPGGGALSGAAGSGNSAFSAPSAVPTGESMLSVRRDGQGRQQLEAAGQRQDLAQQQASENGLLSQESGRRLGEQANQHGKAQQGFRQDALQNTDSGRQNLGLADQNTQSGQQANQGADLQKLLAEAQKQIQAFQKGKEAQGKAVEAKGKTTEVQGKGIETQGKSVETTGKSVETTGHTTEANGHATEATGVGQQAAGEGLLAAGAAALAGGPFSAPAAAALLAKGALLKASGIGLQAVGKGLQAKGKGLQAKGQGLQSKGQGLQAKGQKTQEMGKKTQEKGKNDQNKARTAQEKARDQESKHTDEASKLLEQGRKFLEDALKNKGDAGQNFKDADQAKDQARDQGDLREAAKKGAEDARKAAALDQKRANQAGDNRQAIDQAMKKAFGDNNSALPSTRPQQPSSQGEQASPLTALGQGQPNGSPVPGAAAPGGQSGQSGADQGRGKNKNPQINPLSRSNSALNAVKGVMRPPHGPGGQPGRPDSENPLAANQRPGGIGQSAPTSGPSAQPAVVSPLAPTQDSRATAATARPNHSASARPEPMGATRVVEGATPNATGMQPPAPSQVSQGQPAGQPGQPAPGQDQTGVSPSPTLSGAPAAQGPGAKQPQARFSPLVNPLAQAFAGRAGSAPLAGQDLPLGSPGGAARSEGDAFGETASQPEVPTGDDGQTQRGNASFEVADDNVTVNLNSLEADTPGGSSAPAPATAGDVLAGSESTVDPTAGVVAPQSAGTGASHSGAFTGSGLPGGNGTQQISQQLAKG
jgi:hypothetical protein